MVPPDTAAIRRALGLSQAEFALRYGLTRDAVRAWEIGHRKPSGAALVLLRLIERDPQTVAKMIHALETPAEAVQRDKGVSRYHRTNKPASAHPAPPRGG